MPARQPFTALCQLARRGPHAGRADLHVHTTHSDGAYTPAEVVDLARRSGLAALAITDHDTLAGVLPARQLAAGSDLEIINGIEITCEHRGRELHLLAYFLALDHASLLDALERLRRRRSARFEEMIERLRRRGVSVVVEPGRLAQPHALGRRHLADLLVQAGQAGSQREAFQRYLHDDSPVVVPKERLPVAEALALVRAAGGVAAWAHPPYDCTQEDLAGLHGLGLAAVEVDFPAVRRSRGKQLRAWAAHLGLAVTGGSDCHGPGRHALGCCSISAEELERLRPRG
jgi:predicted metal-dependent phosphoesterase TrpH